MTLPSSGPLSLSDIQGEFGGSNPILLSEYYAGGSLVPSGTTGTNGAVPSSGAISIFNFYGTSAGFTCTVTSGSTSDKFFTYYGYYDAQGIGSRSPTTFGLAGALSGATIVGIWWMSSNTINFTISGIYANSGFTTMTVGAGSYSRASATFNASGGFTSWSWSESTNRFPSIGTPYAVVFT